MAKWSVFGFIFLCLTGFVTAEEKFSDKAFEKHIQKLKKELPAGFHVVIQKPFVVIGNDSADEVERWAGGTVKWTVDRVKKQYFKKNPEKIIDIWLFKDKTSYERHCPKIVGYKPSTPFGFYSSTHDAILMNISTGGGTLVHEIVHPFIESNFPDCPSWFNEGLASLYEQCGDKNGKIWGRTNWRLRGLQLAIQSDRLPPMKEMCSTTTREFYDSTNGYAQARYLCYYLQEKDLLNDFYHDFCKNVKRDPTGFLTLKRIAKINDEKKFDRDWQAYCLKLRFR